MTVTKPNSKYCGIDIPIFGWIIGWLSCSASVMSIFICTYYMSYPYGIPIHLPRVTFYAVLAQAVIECIASILLIVGVMRKSHLLLLPWLITTFFTIIVGTTGVLVIIFLERRRISFFLGIIIILSTALGCGVMTTFWVGIVKLFKSLKNPVSICEASTEDCEVSTTKEKGDIELTNLEWSLYPHPPTYQMEEPCAPSLDILPIDADEHTV